MKQEEPEELIKWHRERRKYYNRKSESSHGFTAGHYAICMFNHHRTINALQELARYKRALEKIKNSPGGGPGKRIATQALGDSQYREKP